MDNFVPTLDHTQTPVGSLIIISNRFHLTQAVVSLVREEGFVLKASNSVPNRFVVECDLTSALTDMNIMEAKAEAMDLWVNTFHWLTEVLEQLPLSLCVPAMGMTTWDGSNSEWWSNPKGTHTWNPMTHTHKIDHT